MDTDVSADFKAQLQRVLAYQDALIKNNVLAQRSCDQEFYNFLTVHNDLRRKYIELRTHVDELDQCIQQYKDEAARKDKKIQSQSSHILRLTQHNKRNNERLAQLQRCLDRIKGSVTEQNIYNQLHDILRNSHMSDGETTADLSDRYCTGDELDLDYSHMPKVVSQSAGIGEVKQASHKNDIQMKLHQSPPGILSTINNNNNNVFINERETNQVSRASSRHSLSADKRPKQKLRKPSKEFLTKKSEESELITDDRFWSKYNEDHLPQILPSPNYNSAEQKTLTPSTPAANHIISTSPSSITKLHAKGHNFISRNILIPETCCVCLKRIHFGKLAYRCQGCNALCHTGCKENCTTLCLPNIKTPNRGAVCKFTPREPNQLQVPALLVHCINEIEQRGLEEIGIYRLNVVEGQVKELKDRLLKSRTGLFDLSHYNDIHLICGVVKDFLRSLSESLLTDALWKSFASVIDEESDVIKYQRFDSLIQQLPKPNRDTLAFLMLHLQRVAASSHCRMPIINLSRTMGPAIIGYSSKHVSGIDLVGETYKQTKILEYFLHMPSHYWSKLLDVNNNVQTTPISKHQIGTPVLIREYHYPNTPTINYPAPSTTFFSPI